MSTSIFFQAEATVSTQCFSVLRYFANSSPKADKDQSHNALVEDVLSSES
jgi:hypothetical protein